MSNFPILVKTRLIFPIPWAPAPFPKRGVRALAADVKSRYHFQDKKHLPDNTNPGDIHYLLKSKFVQQIHDPGGLAKLLTYTLLAGKLPLITTVKHVIIATSIKQATYI